MIAAGRADFTLFEFSSETDFSRTIAGIKRIPVPGIKVGLRGSRPLMASKKYRDGKAVYDALQIWIPKLKQAGIGRTGNPNTPAKGYEQSTCLVSKL